MTATIHSARLDFIPLTPPVIRALLAGDHDAAGRLLGVMWPADCEVHRDALELRLGQLEANPALQPWLMRAMVLREECVAVKHIGFHSSPGHESLEDLAPGAAPTVCSVQNILSPLIRWGGKTRMEGCNVSSRQSYP